MSPALSPRGLPPPLADTMTLMDATKSALTPVGFRGSMSAVVLSHASPKKLKSRQTPGLPPDRCLAEAAK